MQLRIEGDKRKNKPRNIAGHIERATSDCGQEGSVAAGTTKACNRQQLTAHSMYEIVHSASVRQRTLQQWRLSALLDAIT